MSQSLVLYPEFDGYEGKKRSTLVTGKNNDCTGWYACLPEWKRIKFLEREKQFKKCLDRPRGCTDCLELDKCIKRWDRKC